MALKKVLVKAKVIPAVKRYTIDAVTKFSTKNKRNLPQLLSLFPNYGTGFKIYLKNDKDNYYIVDRVIIKSNKHAKFFGILYQKDVMIKKIDRLKYILKKGLWNFEPSSNITTTENGLEYNIARYEDLIYQKKNIIAQRGKLLDLPNPLKTKKDELKKKKEAAIKPKKKF